MEEKSKINLENDFIVCQCPKPTEIYDSHLGDGGYDWCKKCDCILGDIQQTKEQ